jgi:hypothetical protein
MMNTVLVIFFIVIIVETYVSSVNTYVNNAGNLRVNRQLEHSPHPEHSNQHHQSPYKNEKHYILALEKEFYQNCNVSLSPDCTYHHISLSSSVSYDSLTHHLTQFSTILMPTKEQLSGSSHTKDKRIIFIGVEFSQVLSNDIVTEIDRFLAERPYYELINIHLHDDKSSISIPPKDPSSDSSSETPSSPSYASSPSSSWMVLRLLPWKVHQLLSSFASIYFPSALECSQRPLAVDMDAWGTWGNRFSITALHEENYPEAIFAVFLGDHCKHHEGNRFASHSSCPHLINKFNCIFLPSTNCSLPDYLMNCELSKSLTGDFYFFSNATSSATLLQDPNVIESFREQPHIKSLSRVNLLFNSYDSNFQELTPSSRIFRPNDTEFISASTTALYENNPSEFLYEDRIGFTYLYGLHYRPSLLFRNAMAETIRISRISSYFGILSPNDSCIAIHLRKDDRQINGNINMREWCSNYTNHDPKISDRDHRPSGIYNGHSVDYGMWMDYGCLYHIPYGYTTLEYFLNASLVMSPTNQNLFIMTDDPEWLDNAMNTIFPTIMNFSKSHSLEEYEKRQSSQLNQQQQSQQQSLTKYKEYEKLKIFTIADKRNDHSNRYESNIQFWSSIELARQCSGLIIHPGSAVGRFIALATCFRNNRGFEYLHCPDVFDMSGGELW